MTDQDSPDLEVFHGWNSPKITHLEDVIQNGSQAKTLIYGSRTFLEYLGGSVLVETHSELSHVQTASKMEILNSIRSIGEPTFIISVLIRQLHSFTLF